MSKPMTTVELEDIERALLVTFLKWVQSESYSSSNLKDLLAKQMASSLLEKLEVVDGK